jgi:hypothetical protein
MSKILTLIAIVALIVALIVAGPLLIIWALNTLFPVLAIAYTWETWLAALILGATVGPSVKVRK